MIRTRFFRRVKDYKKAIKDYKQLRKRDRAVSSHKEVKING